MAASISQLLTRPPKPTTFSLSSSNSNSFTSPCLFPTTTTTPNPTKMPKISCNANNNSPTPPDDHLNRRNILLGLGGLSSAAALSSLKSPINSAHADPYPPMATVVCDRITQYDPTSKPPTYCCPPFKPGDAFTEFVLPDIRKTPLRLRPAAHLVDTSYVKKFNRALRLMMDLHEGDPRSFRQQAMVHCAYCEGGYRYNGTKTQIHFNWLFLPWHRMYLYFFEKILCNMIDDETFAIPFWNWDAAAGMKIPEMYKDRTSFLYDPYRELSHLDALADLNFDTIDKEVPVAPEKRIRENLATMHRQVLNNSKTPELFLGCPYVFGRDITITEGIGHLESLPHNTIHSWVGDSTQPNYEDMGNFYSAGRDPIFYAHHGNVDRMWDLWKTLVWQKKEPEFNNNDWLNATFLFFNEKGELISTKVSDSLSSTALRYNYVDVPIEWIDTPPTVKTTKASRMKRSAVPIIELSNFPIKLSSIVTTRVKRPEEAKNTTKKHEFIVVEGIEVEENKFATFDVYINVPEGHEALGRDARELAGSFAILPHHHKVKTSMRFSLNEIMKELEIDQDDYINVTLVPRGSAGSVKIGGLNIELFD